MPQPVPDLTGAELDVLVRKALAQAGRALSAGAVHAALPRALRPPRAAVAERLHALAQTSDAHVWPGGRSTLYAARPYAEHLREQVLATLAQRPRTAAELARGVPASAAPKLRALLGELVRDGRVFKHPPLRRRTLYARSAPDALDYLRDPVQRLIRDFVRRGFTEAGVRDALRRCAGGAAPETRATGAEPARNDTSADAERLLAGLVELDPQARHGALVYLPHLRQALRAEVAEPARFDRAVLGLLARGVIQLQSHPVPSQLTDDERAAMIADGRGSFYMAIGLRR
jgi:hypothetical protein